MSRPITKVRLDCDPTLRGVNPYTYGSLPIGSAGEKFSAATIGAESIFSQAVVVDRDGVEHFLSVDRPILYPLNAPVRVFCIQIPSSVAGFATLPLDVDLWTGSVPTMAPRRINRGQALPFAADSVSTTNLAAATGTIINKFFPTFGRRIIQLSCTLLNAAGTIQLVGRKYLPAPRPNFPQQGLEIPAGVLQSTLPRGSATFATTDSFAGIVLTGEDWDYCYLTGTITTAGELYAHYNVCDA